MKKIIALLLASVMVLSLFAGCGSSAKPAETQAAASAETQAAAPVETAAPVEITVAAIETAYGSEMWAKVAEAFTAETGINVKLVTDKNLEDVISASMQGGEYPDFVHLPIGREKALTEQFIKDKAIADITDVLSMTVPGETKKVSEKISGGFTETSQTNPYGDGKTYLAPMFYSPCGLFYNAKLFEAKGWSVPTTWDEMWALGETAKAEGIALFTYPTTGYFDSFVPAMLYTVGGADFFDAVTTYQDGAWESAEGAVMLEVMAKVAEYTNKTTPAQANDQDFTKNQLMVMEDKALFMPNGTWIVGEMAAAEETLTNDFAWGMTAMPAAEGSDSYSYCWFEQSWIPAGAANIDAAKQFVAFLYSDKACEIFAEAGAIQPVNGIASMLEGDNKMFYSIYDNGAKAAMGGFAAFTAVPGLGSVREVFFDPMNSLVEGSLTIDEYKAYVIEAIAQMKANLIG